MTDKQGKRDRSFQEFQEDFYAAFEDPTVFDCQEFNLLKVVQDGLKVGYQFRTYWGLPLWMYSLILLVRRVVAKLKGQSTPFGNNSIKQLGNRPYLLLDAGRYVQTEAGSLTSVYFHRFLKAIPEKDRTFVLEREGVEARIPYDLSIQDFANDSAFLPITEDDKQLYRDLRQKLSDWELQTTFAEEEMAQIRCGLDLFWNRYRVWNHLVQALAPKTAFLTCHYHKEGLILALKRNEVEVIELQHGLIAAEDIFYVYPEKVAEVTPKALFADKIWAYGAYWKEVLLQGVEYSADQIEIKGYYLYEKAERDQAFIQSVKQQAGTAPILLITTQTLLYQVFIDYVEWLSQDLIQKNIPGFVIVKPHPANKPGTYQALSELPNVIVSRDDLYDLFAASDLHLSIYSTTLYEATRQGLPNYALYLDSCADYVDSILASGVAQRIDWGENPFEQSQTSPQAVDPAHYFAPFSFSTQPTSIA